MVSSKTFAPVCSWGLKTQLPSNTSLRTLRSKHCAGKFVLNAPSLAFAMVVAFFSLAGIPPVFIDAYKHLCMQGKTDSVGATGESAGQLSSVSCRRLRSILHVHASVHGVVYRV